MFLKEKPKTREECIDYLVNHFRYNTLNSWNNSTSYANNVKLQNLGLTKEQFNLAFNYLFDAEYNINSYLFDKDVLLNDFYIDTGYVAQFNGKSNGYLVLYDCENGRVYIGRSIDQYEDFEDWETEDIKERVELVRKFDKLTDDIRELLIKYLDNSKILEVEKNVKLKTKVVTL